MPVSRAETGRGDPEEWQNGAKVARFARQRVAERVAEMIVENDLTGSKDLVRQRLAELIEAERAEDPLLIHAATMELSAASAAYAVGLQLQTPLFTSRLVEELGAAGEIPVSVA